MGVKPYYEETILINLTFLNVLNEFWSGFNNKKIIKCKLAYLLRR